MLRVLLLGLTLVWVAAPLGAQPVFRSGIDLVHFGVTVLDKQGKLVPDLTADDFEVHEEGEEQVVTYFTYGVEVSAVTPPAFTASASADIDADTVFQIWGYRKGSIDGITHPGSPSTCTSASLTAAETVMACATANGRSIF